MANRKKILETFGDKAGKRAIKKAGSSIESRDIVPVKQDGKYYVVLQGTDLKKEINAKQYAGKVGAQKRIRDEGKFISKAEESRVGRAASNMGEKDLQKFFDQNKERLRTYPAQYVDELHIGSALKSITSFGKEYRFRINGKFAKRSDVLKYIHKTNKEIDEGQKTGDTPNIFITFNVDENKKTLSIRYKSEDENENEQD